MQQKNNSNGNKKRKISKVSRVKGISIAADYTNDFVDNLDKNTIAKIKRGDPDIVSIGQFIKNMGW